MTEPRRPRPAQARRPGPIGVVIASLATFLVVLAFLADQMASGHDPALGGRRADTAQVAPRRVVVRRIVKQRVIVTKVEPGDDEGEVSDGGTAVVDSSAPPVATSAPAPTPAAAPVAPPTTRSS
jgi:hypothetical protein